MARLDDTAYPRLKAYVSAHDLALVYTPTWEEVALANGATKGSAARVCFLVLLKTYQATLTVTTCAHAEAAAGDAGLTPQAKRAGTSVRGRERSGHSGHKRRRTALDRATLSAARCNPLIKAFYDRRRAAGKPPKVARCAAARKLLQLAWAVVRRQRACDPHDQPVRPAA